MLIETHRDDKCEIVHSCFIKSFKTWILRSTGGWRGNTSQQQRWETSLLGRMEVAYEHSNEIFGITEQEVTGGWGEVHNGGLYNLYFSLNKLVLGWLSRGEFTEIGNEHNILMW